MKKVILLNIAIIFFSNLVIAQSSEEQCENAVLEVKKGAYQKAINLCNDIIKSDKNHLNAYQIRGELHTFFKTYGKAKKDFKYVIKSDPNRPRPYFYLGLISEKQYKYKKSLNFYSLALAIDSTSIETIEHRDLVVKFSEFGKDKRSKKGNKTIEKTENTFTLINDLLDFFLPDKFRPR